MVVVLRIRKIVRCVAAVQSHIIRCIFRQYRNESGTAFSTEFWRWTVRQMSAGITAPGYIHYCGFLAIIGHCHNCACAARVVRDDAGKSCESLLLQLKRSRITLRFAREMVVVLFIHHVSSFCDIWGC